MATVVRWKDAHRASRYGYKYHAADIVAAIRSGKILVYPTDTIYGIGCNALLGRSVQKVRRLKGTDHPFSVIAPSKQWIRDHLTVRFPEFLDKLPGPYTLILPKPAAFLVDASPSATLGVRIPNHPFTQLVRKAGVPLITTSANLSGQSPMKEIADIPAPFQKHVDLLIDAGRLDHLPSRIFDLTGLKPMETKRILRR
ncbi:MAG: Sua5/YciO/YrdC/YwlC family protein [Candidatus Aenigmarchaeota archaeon]|nr:Sua5/YciO/YrdC/YwlC family protein [Candidatus Aenigmarchaeota archaeon]